MPINTTNSINILPSVLAAAVATSGTVTFSYPNAGVNLAATGFNKGNYLFSNNQHKLQIGQTIYTSPKDFTLTFNANASGITVTNKGASTWPAGSIANLQLNTNGPAAPRFNDVVVGTPSGNSDLTGLTAVLIDLGSPAAGTATGVCLAQAVASAKNLTLNGALVTSSIAYLPDVQRTLQFVSANAGDTTQTVTITGFDKFNAKVTETVTLNGTTIVTSKKALATVTNLAISAATAGNISVGASNILGLPIAIYKSAVQVLKESQDGAVATAGTFVNADLSTATATTGDVRGTYLPNATPDGSKGFAIFALVPDPSDIGVTNFSV
jgi:hypothetical protein